MTKRIGRWLGGYIRESHDGRRIFVIERWMGGARCHKSTGCSTERAALKELERFELDPIGYRPAGSQVVPRLTPELVTEFRTYQLEPPPKGRGLSREWVDEVTRCLGDWADALGPKDLRTLTLHEDLRPALDKWPTRRPHRIKALKALTRWLRQEKGLLTHRQDATVDLRVPQARPEKWTRRKVVAPEDVRAVLVALAQPTRDVLHLLTATAWHCSEVRRFAAGGEIVRPAGNDGPLAVLVARHKSGELTRTPILYAEHLAAAEQLRARGALPSRVTLERHMRRACDRAGVSRFCLGQMRHSVLTWAVEHGATADQAADFAQHRSKATTTRWYVDVAVPRTAIPILRLL